MLSSIRSSAFAVREVQADLIADLGRAAEEDALILAVARPGQSNPTYELAAIWKRHHRPGHLKHLRNCNGGNMWTR